MRAPRLGWNFPRPSPDPATPGHPLPQVGEGKAAHRSINNPSASDPELAASETSIARSRRSIAIQAISRALHHHDERLQRQHRRPIGVALIGP